MREKADIRREMLAKRNALSDLEVGKRSARICENIRKFFYEQKAKGRLGMAKPSYILGYAAKGREADIWQFFEFIWASENNIHIALPRVCGRDMDFYIIRSLEDLENGCFGLQEPKLHMPRLERRDLQKENCLILVPGLAFAKESRQRIGYGAGYYDRYFKDMDLDMYGIAYDFQVMEEEFETYAGDIAMKSVITDM